MKSILVSVICNTSCNCGDKNHLSATCPVKENGIERFKCDEYAHIANCSNALERYWKGMEKKNTRDCNITQVGRNRRKDIIRMLDS